MSKILIVDDNKGILDSLGYALRMFKHEVECTLTADSVFEIILNFNPDIVILDLLLSGESGTNICRAIKANAHTKNLPVIMMSAHPSAQDIALEAGADDFLPKPFSLQVLSEMVEKYEKVQLA